MLNEKSMRARVSSSSGDSIFSTEVTEIVSALYVPFKQVPIVQASASSTSPCSSASTKWASRYSMVSSPSSSSMPGGAPMFASAMAVVLRPTGSVDSEQPMHSVMAVPTSPM